MLTKFKLFLYGIICIGGVIWPFYFLADFIEVIKTESFNSPIEIVNLFVSGVWANPASSFIASDLTLILLGIFIFIYTESKRLEIKNYFLYYILTFAVSFAFSFGLFMFNRERKLNSSEI